MSEPVPPVRTRGRAITVALVAVVVLAAVAAGVFEWLQSEFRTPGPSTNTVRLQVEPRASVRTVLNDLGRLQVVRHPRAIEWYLRLHRRSPRIQTGMYEIPPASSPAQVLELFEQGRVVLEQLTVIEGSTFADLRRELDQHAAITHTSRGKTDAEVMAALGHPGEFPEGRFFPDTYRFAARTTDLEILSLAYASMARVLAAAWQERSEGLPIQTPYEALTLASVIEKETGLPAERPRIAGVFVSRLKLGMRLQSDPTVIYGLGARYDGDIRTRDLVTDTAYNTYTRSGLPPTPIASPGRESIFAAVHPLDTGELYFVATAGGDGGHHFSKTLEEHNAAVKAYLQRLRAQQRTVASHRTVGSPSPGTSHHTGSAEGK